MLLGSIIYVLGGCVLYSVIYALWPQFCEFRFTILCIHLQFLFYYLFLWCDVTGCSFPIIRETQRGWFQLRIVSLNCGWWFWLYICRCISATKCPIYDLKVIQYYYVLNFSDVDFKGQNFIPMMMLWSE